MWEVIDAGGYRVLLGGLVTLGIWAGEGYLPYEPYWHPGVLFGLFVVLCSCFTPGLTLSSFLFVVGWAAIHISILRPKGCC